MSLGYEDPRGSETGRAVLVVVAVMVVLLLAGVILARIRNGPEQQAVETQQEEPTAPAAPPLELLSTRWDRSDGGRYVVVSGEVRNDTSEPIGHLIAIANVYDGRGSLVNSEEGIVEYDPLLPGQRSPFKVMVTYNPAIKSGDVAFKKALGPQLLYVDHRASRK